MLGIGIEQRSVPLPDLRILIVLPVNAPAMATAEKYLPSYHLAGMRQKQHL